MYMPQWDPNAESLVTGPSQDDHDGGPAAGVASGFDPSGGEPCYQFGNQWVSCVSAWNGSPCLSLFCGRLLPCGVFHVLRAYVVESSMFSTVCVVLPRGVVLMDVMSCAGA